MMTVQIDKSSALFYIRPASAGYLGRYYFCPECADGNGAGFRYLEPSRAWNPCPHHYFAIVPTLRPEVEIHELFETFVENLGDGRRSELYAQGREAVSPDKLDRLIPEERRAWKQCVDDARAWLAEQWRLALNDLPNDLGWAARDVWGAQRDAGGDYIAQKPEERAFVWAEG